MAYRHRENATLTPDLSPTGEEMDITVHMYTSGGRRGRYTVPPSRGVPEPPTTEIEEITNADTGQLIADEDLSWEAWDYIENTLFHS